MAKSAWKTKLTRTVRDTDGNDLRSFDAARRHMTALPEREASRSQWQAAARLLLEGADAEQVTRQVELALMYAGRLDVRHANEQQQA